MNTTKEKLDIRKMRNRQKYYLTLKAGQRISFVAEDGSIYGELEIRDGKMYLMKHKDLNGHTWQGESFGKEVSQ